MSDRGPVLVYSDKRTVEIGDIVCHTSTYGNNLHYVVVDVNVPEVLISVSPVYINKQKWSHLVAPEDCDLVMRGALG